MSNPGLLALSRLAAICPPAFLLLIPTHARAQGDIHSRRHREPEALRHLVQIQPVDIKDRAERVTRVRLQVAAIAVLGAAVEVVVLSDEFLELGLHVDDAVGGEFEFDEGHASLFEVDEEAYLAGLEEHEGAAGAVAAAGGAADAVDVVARVVGGIELQDPVDRRDLWMLIVLAEVGVRWLAWLWVGRGKQKKKTYV